MLFDVTTNTNKINIMPKNEIEEILQNVRMIITTLKGSAPLDRNFGVSSVNIDLPIASSQAKMTAEIIAAVRKFEPRAKVVNVFYDGDFADGQLIFRVQIELVDY